MTDAFRIRSAVFPSLALTVMLVAQTPNNLRAEDDVSSFETLSSHQLDVSAQRHETTASGRTAPRRSGPAPTVDSALVENAWDFTKPDDIPGFASTPYPVLSETDD